MPTHRVNRRQFLQKSLVTAAIAGSSNPALPRPASRNRNVILIISDTMRRDALGCYGGRWVQCPHLDLFARSAVQFRATSTAFRISP